MRIGLTLGGVFAVMSLAACATTPAAGPSAVEGESAGGVRVERITVHGASLEGNLLGESPDRETIVYLPPSYAAEPDRRYPVIYFLHGYFLDEEGYHTAMDFPGSIERGFAAGAREAIVVMPDGDSKYNGSMYSNSVTTGDWETFVAEDLVGYMDSHYRTIPERDARGLSGHSMGGYGTLRIGMKRPDVFSSLYAMSACCLDARRAGPGDADLPNVDTVAEVDALGIAATTYAASAAWSPNPDNPPFYLDFPIKDGEVQPEVIARYAANAPNVMMVQYVPALRSYDAIAMDIGDQDGLKVGVDHMDALLSEFGIAHGYEVYEGDHVNRVAERFEKNLMPFFSEHLAFEE
jgi:S-formylglutathione hydrolase FrmB